MSPRTEILATLLQYRTWMEFMYEILYDVPPPPNQNPGAGTGAYTGGYVRRNEIELY